MSAGGHRPSSSIVGAEALLAAPARFGASCRSLLLEWSPRRNVSGGEFGWCVLGLVAAQLALWLLASPVHHLLSVANRSSQWRVLVAVEGLWFVLLMKAVAGRYLDAGVRLRVLVLQVLVLALCVWGIARMMVVLVDNTFSDILEGPPPLTNADRTTVGLGVLAALVALLDIGWAVALTARRSSRAAVAPIESETTRG